MTTPTLTPEDVARLLSAALEQVAATNDDTRTYTLTEVAKRTGLAHKYILAGCRAKKFEHVSHGNTRAMTARQITILINRHSVGGDLVAHEPDDPDDEVAAARKATARSGARRPSRRVA